MPRFGLDSTGEVSVGAHHAVGSSVALRYLSRFTSKVVTSGEHQRYRAGGIDLVLVFEDFADSALRGYDQGKADAEFALRQAIGILGRPAMDPAIHFAVDFDTAGSPGRTDPYFDGVRAVLPNTQSGPYGGIEVCRHQFGRGFRHIWQTYAWSRGLFFPPSSSYQYSNDHTVGGVGVDFNHCFGDDFGQWDRPLPVPPDPHRYLWFSEGKRRWGGFTDLNERLTVQEYDALRSHPLLHARHLHVLKQRLHALAELVWYEAHRDHLDLSKGPVTFPTPRPNWSYRHRGWRFQQLIRRAQGKKLV